MLERLRRAGLKITRQREVIVAELADDVSHPTAQELFERVRVSQPGVSFATVYNTLDSLARAGLCTPRALSPGATRFDPNTEPHHHAVCDSCGLVWDLPAAPATTAAPPPTLPDAGFEVRAVEQIVRGLCADCARHKTLPHRAGGGAEQETTDG